MAMNGLDRITDKILAEAQERADRILADAQAESEKITKIRRPDLIVKE